MIIKQNIPSLNAQRNGAVNTKATAKNLEKLSSGCRINRSADDSAGLAISEKMRGQIRGLAMAEQNSANGISLIKTAEGGLNEAHAILHRMRELAVQAANGTYQDEDRVQIEREMQAVKQELNRIAASTNYNSIPLLDGTIGGKYATGLSGGYLQGQEGNASFYSEGGTLGALVNKLTDMGFAVATGSGTPVATQTGTVDIKTHAAALDGKSASLIIVPDPASTSTSPAPAQHVSMQIGDKLYVADYVIAPDSCISADGATIAIGTDSYVFKDENGSAVAVLNNTNGSNYYPLTATTDAVIKGVRLPATSEPLPTSLIGTSGTSVGRTEIPEGHPMYNAFIGTGTDRLVFQIGANGALDQSVGLRVPNMSSACLGMPDAAGFKSVAAVSVVARELANEAIDVIDAAVAQVSVVRSNLGSLQNRLEHTLNNLGVTKENLTASESIIRDVDMAQEMMAFTKNNILTQSSQAMLAQANQLPQGVLQLLK